MIISQIFFKYQVTIWGGDAVIEIGSDSAMKKRKDNEESYNTIYFLNDKGWGFLSSSEKPQEVLFHLIVLFFFFFFLGGGGGGMLEIVAVILLCEKKKEVKFELFKQRGKYTHKASYLRY